MKFSITHWFLIHPVSYSVTLVQKKFFLHLLYEFKLLNIPSLSCSCWDKSPSRNHYYHFSLVHLTIVTLHKLSETIPFYYAVNRVSNNTLKMTTNSSTLLLPYSKNISTSSVIGFVCKCGSYEDLKNIKCSHLKSTINILD